MAISFRTELAAAGDESTALTNAFTKAAQTANRTLDPYTETGIYSGKGPNARMGEVIIARDTGSADFQGKNRLVFNKQVGVKSFTCLTVDSGVCLVYAIPNDGQLLNWDINGLTSVMVRTGDTTRGTGKRAGKFMFDGDSGVSFNNVKRRRFINFGDVQFWLIEDIYSYQPLGGTGSITAGSAVFPFHGDSEANSPRDGIYRRHNNEHSPSGYGPNQIASAFRLAISDIDSEGGTALRFETDGNAVGVHNIEARRISCLNGNRVVSMSPHHADSDHVNVVGLDGRSCYEGIRLASNPEGAPNGLFTQCTISDGCFVAGNSAQDPSQGGVVGNDPSNRVINDNADNGATITITDIGYSGFTTANRGNHTNPGGSPPPVYDTTKTCPRPYGTGGGGGGGGDTNDEAPAVTWQSPADVVTAKLVTVKVKLTDPDGIAWAKARKSTDAPGVFIDMAVDPDDPTIWSCQMTLDGTPGTDVANSIRVDCQDNHATLPRTSTQNMRTVVVRLPFDGGGGGGDGGGDPPPVDSPPSIPGSSRGDLPPRTGGPQAYEVPARDAVSDLQQRMAILERGHRALVSNPQPAVPTYDDLPRDLSDGQLMIDKATNELVYIIGGVTYRLPGTPG